MARCRHHARNASPRTCTTIRLPRRGSPGARCAAPSRGPPIQLFALRRLRTTLGPQRGRTDPQAAATRGALAPARLPRRTMRGIEPVGPRVSEPFLRKICGPPRRFLWHCTPPPGGLPCECGGPAAHNNHNSASTDARQRASPTNRPGPSEPASGRHLHLHGASFSDAACLGSSAPTARTLTIARLNCGPAPALDLGPPWGLHASAGPLRFHPTLTIPSY